MTQEEFTAWAREAVRKSLEEKFRFTRFEFFLRDKEGLCGGCLVSALVMQKLGKTLSEIEVSYKEYRHRSWACSSVRWAAIHLGIPADAVSDIIGGFDNTRSPLYDSEWVRLGRELYETIKRSR